MPALKNFLHHQRTMVIFTYAPAGLGHLRVVDALYHGLPSGVTPVLLGSQDVNISRIHRIHSTYSWAVKLMEFTQKGLAEDIFTYYYRRFLRQRTDILYEQLVTLLEQRLEMAETVLVIATHFGLAHQVAEIKDRLMREKQIRIFLAVQVTDDSPQHLWFVDGADLISVPSQKTRLALMRYGYSRGYKPVDITVNPYPVSPHLAIKLTADGTAKKYEQAQPGSNSPVNISVPVSGAAVGQAFLLRLTDYCGKTEPRLKFHVVCRSTPYTAKTISEFLNRKNTHLITASHQREIVNRYEDMLVRQSFLVEITKPSEQTFKALLSPRQRGGVILMFMQAIGRQEYDNLDFLIRHRLLPDRKLNSQLWKWARADKDVPVSVLNQAPVWRGICLPEDPLSAGEFIKWCLKQGIWATMLKYKANQVVSPELGDDGVVKFWETVGEKLNYAQTHTSRSE